MVSKGSTVWAWTGAPDELRSHAVGYWGTVHHDTSTWA